VYKPQVTVAQSQPNQTSHVAAAAAAQGAPPQVNLGSQGGALVPSQAFSSGLAASDMEIENDIHASEMARQRSGSDERALRQQVRNAHREFAPGAPGAIMAANSFATAAPQLDSMKKKKRAPDAPNLTDIQKETTELYAELAATSGNFDGHYHPFNMGSKEEAHELYNEQMRQTKEARDRANLAEQRANALAKELAALRPFDSMPVDSEVLSDEDGCEKSTWDINAPFSEWSDMRVQDFLRDYPERAPRLVSIDKVDRPYSTIGNLFVSCTLEHPLEACVALGRSWVEVGDRGQKCIRLSSSIMHGVPQYRDMLDEALSRGE